MKFPATLQFVVQVADRSFWLYERKVELNIPAYAGLCLRAYCPNITGPVAGFDNRIMQVVDTPDELLCKIQGTREPSFTIEEMDGRLPDWKRQPEALARPDTNERTPDDEIDRLFNG